MDTSPPTELVLDRPRRGTPASKPALLYIGMVVLAIVLFSVIWGVKKRMFNHSATRSAATQETPIAPASSNRESVERTSASSQPTKVTVRQPERSQSSSGETIPPTDGPVITFQPATTMQGNASASNQPVDPEIDLEKKARESATTVKFETTSAKVPAANSQNPLLEIPQVPSSGSSDPALERLIRSAQSVAARQPEATTADSKEQFAKSDTTPLAIRRTGPNSDFALSPGTKIQAVLTSNANSQLLGRVEAMVRQDVFNSTCGQPGHGCYIEIPKGSKLEGEYNSQVSYAQNRMQIAWNLLIFPDQSTVDLGKMAAYSADGTAGLRDKSDQHIKRIIWGALLTSSISAGISLSQSRNNTPLSYPSAGQVAGASVGQGLGELGNQITSKNVNIPPYNKLRIGLPLVVDINRPMLFEAPYEPIAVDAK